MISGAKCRPRNRDGALPIQFNLTADSSWPVGNTSIFSEDLDWKPLVALPTPMHLAVIVGEPSEPVIYGIQP